MPRSLAAPLVAALPPLSLARSGHRATPGFHTLRRTRLLAFRAPAHEDCILKGSLALPPTQKPVHAQTVRASVTAVQAYKLLVPFQSSPPCRRRAPARPRHQQEPCTGLCCVSSACESTSCRGTPADRCSAPLAALPAYQHRYHRQCLAVLPPRLLLQLDQCPPCRSCCARYAYRSHCPAWLPLCHLAQAILGALCCRTLTSPAPPPTHPNQRWGRRGLLLRSSPAHLSIRPRPWTNDVRCCIE